jgi:hypothetical protein
MGTKRLLKAGVLGLLAVFALGLATAGPASAQTDDLVAYKIEVENLTAGQPFTPPLVVAHSGDIDVFEVGEAASQELSQIAENGNGDPLVGVLGGSDAVFDFAAGDGPILPGASATLMLEAPEGGYLSTVFMLICTNDGFSGIDSLLLPASGSEMIDANAYDAGSETNTEDFADLVPPCQEVIGVMSDDDGTGMSNPALAEGGVVAMHPGVQGVADLTVGDHGWTDPVARISVTVEGEAPNGLPSAGTGPTDGGGVSVWLLYLGIGGAALLAFGGAAQFARRRMAR